MSSDIQCQLYFPEPNQLEMPFLAFSAPCILLSANAPYKKAMQQGLPLPRSCRTSPRPCSAQCRSSWLSGRWTGLPFACMPRVSGRPCVCHRGPEQRACRFPFQRRRRTPRHPCGSLCPCRRYPPSRCAWPWLRRLWMKCVSQIVHWV